MDSFTALADPTRRQIVEMVASKGELSASEISGRFDMSAPAISQHLKVLREAGLVKMEKRAQQRIYSIDAAAFSEMEQWIAQMRRFWNGRLDMLETLIRDERSKKAKNQKPKPKKEK